MYRILMLSALAGLALSACKPTPRTAITRPQSSQTETPAETDTPPADTPAPPATETPATEGATPPTAPAQPTEQASSVATSLLSLSATRQDFSRLRPWEKEDSSAVELMGIYLGEGKVLSLGSAALAATYVEISLPDGSRSVPARVLRHDHDLNLALLTPVHEEDMSIFETRQPLELGEALKLGDEAAFDALVSGLIPVRIPLRAESGEVANTAPLLHMPRLTLRAGQPLPDDSVQGLPVLRDGKLVGVVSGGNHATQSVYCINAELIARFLAAPDGEYASCPMMGIEFTGLSDPVFRRYLKLADTQGGLYVNDVAAGGAAEQAGLRVGDVVTAVEGMEVDMQSRCTHPLYGALAARALLRSLKPAGETLTLTISRDGQKQDVTVPLNREALSKSLMGQPELPGTQPRYVMWGGLLFQPMTQDYLLELGKRTNGTMPVSFLELKSREKELREKGVTEIVMLTQVIPTPATLSYEEVSFCFVESVNGKPVHNFAEFVRLLDEPTPDGLVAFGLNKAPYTIYVDRRVAETCNSAIRRNAIQQLRQLGKDGGETAAP